MKTIVNNRGSRVNKTSTHRMKTIVYNRVNKISTCKMKAIRVSYLDWQTLENNDKMKKKGWLWRVTMELETNE